MARECDGPDRAAKTVCRLQCRERYGSAAQNPTGDGPSAYGHVYWAGFPINLDLAFSAQQRDKVYLQHLMRKHRAQLWRQLHNGPQLCVCETAAEDANLGPDAAWEYV